MPRYAGMKPRRLVVLTMSIAGMLSGLARTINILGINHRVNATPSAATVDFRRYCSRASWSRSVIR